MWGRRSFFQRLDFPELANAIGARRAGIHYAVETAKPDTSTIFHFLIMSRSGFYGFMNPLSLGSSAFRRAMNISYQIIYRPETIQLQSEAYC
jgi:hypothetical protein